jgi:Crp-like helix-turn-helix domain
LLQSADRAESDTLELTQEFLAEMLGVRRTSVTEVATKIQETGAIHYTRGVIKILDRAALEKMSCECYQTQIKNDLALIVLAASTMAGNRAPQSYPPRAQRRTRAPSRRTISRNPSCLIS